MTPTAADIHVQEADLSEPLVLFGIAIQKVPGKHSRQRPSAGSHSSQTCYAISLSYFDHLEIGGRRRLDSGSGYCHNSLRMSMQACLVVPDHTSNDSHSSHAVVNVQVSCLSLWSLKLGHRYSCSHARVSKRPPADLASHSLQYFTCCKRATGCDVIHSMHTFANWSIVAVLHKGCIAHIAHRCLTALHHPLKPCTIKSICPMQIF